MVAAAHVRIAVELSPTSICPYCQPSCPPSNLSADRVKVGGASAGSLLAACLKSGMPLDEVVEQNL